MSSHSGFYDASCVFVSGDRVTAKTTSITTEFCSTMNISKYMSWVAHQGQSLPSMMVLFSWRLSTYNERPNDTGRQPSGLGDCIQTDPTRKMVHSRRMWCIAVPRRTVRRRQMHCIRCEWTFSPCQRFIVPSLHAPNATYRPGYSNTTVYYGIHQRSECIPVDSGVTNLIHDRRSCVDFTLEVGANVARCVHSSVNKLGVKHNSGS